MSVRMIEVLDKKKKEAFSVFPSYHIEFGGIKYQLKDLEYENMKIIGVIIQENGEIDLCYKKEEK